MKQKWFNIFFLIAILISCIDEEEIDRSYPTIVTNPVTEILPSGATFSGKIESSSLNEISEYGFVWGQDDKLLPENSFSLKFGKPLTNIITTKIKSSLVAQKIYYARFYIKTDDKTIYGNLVTFKSLGSEGPIITALSPPSGVLGDTVIIRGRNFVAQEEKNVVKFGSQEVSILSLTDSTISVIVPGDLSLDSEHVNVSVSIEGNVANSPEPFTLILSKIIPVITSVAPINIKACDTVLVVGKNFTSSSNLLKVFLQNNEEATLIKATDDSVMFSVKLLPPNDFGFTIKTGRFDVKSEKDFTELRPEFISVSPLTHEPGGVMTIAVKNFPTCFPVVVSAYGYNVDVVSTTENEVKIKLSDGCSYPWDINIGFGATYYDYFLITPPIPPKPLTIFSVEPNHGAVGQEVVIHGEGFRFLQEDYTYFLNITSYTENEIRGTVKEIYMWTNEIDVSVYACGRFATLEKGFEYDPPVILDFNPKIITTAEQLITIEGQNFSTVSNNLISFNNSSIQQYEAVSLDGSHITVPASVIITDPFIEMKFSTPITVRTQMGTEVTSSTNLVVDHEGPWAKLNDFPSTERYFPISFTIAGKGYVGLGVGPRYSPTRDLWEFEPSTETWTRKADFPGAYEAELPDASVANGKAYVMVLGGGELWEYDPSLNSWTQRTAFPGLASSYKLMIGINNKIYVGGGYYEGSSNEFWEYDPLIDTWTRKANIPGELSSRSLFYEVDGKGYAYYTPTANQKTRLAYDPIADSWSSSQVPNFNEASPWQVLKFDDYTIVLGGTYYDQGNIMYKIVPGNDSLIPIPYAGQRRGAAAGFSIGKTGYIGLGSYAVILKDLWKFVPEKF